ncbi:carbohydrate ABC transporter permease (plasmid) [Fusobacteria bacterium ZRK30]|nr:carbohydrate ABC transporter permease [Fusobacteria bacterium ZRK30]
MFKNLFLMKRKNFNSDSIFYLVNGIYLTIAFLLVAYPILFIVSSSFSSPEAVSSGKVWLFPVDFSLAGYRELLGYKPVWTGYYNSFFYAIVGTTISVTLTVLAGYALSRKQLYGRRLFTFIILFTMIFQGGIIPTYILMQDLNLIDTRWAVILPRAIVVFNFVITKNFFENNIPDELYEAAKIDGASEFQFFIKVVLPLSKPIIAILVLYYSVFIWNSFFDAMIYLRDKSLYPLQLTLRDVLILNEVSSDMMADPDLLQELEGMRDLLKYALIIVASLPVLVAYPFIQKYFVSGRLSGASKG